MKGRIIGLDFDGTCVTHMYPLIGDEISGAVDVLRELTNAGHKIVLFTMRSGVELSMAVTWFHFKGIPLHGVNEEPNQKSWTSSPKAYAELYIDDAALGCPLFHPKGQRPHVDWRLVRCELVKRGFL